MSSIWNALWRIKERDQTPRSGSIECAGWVTKKLTKLGCPGLRFKSFERWTNTSRRVIPSVESTEKMFWICQHGQQVPDF
jgi:hypothetical protein